MTLSREVKKALHVVGGASFSGGTAAVVRSLASSPIPGVDQYVWMCRDFLPREADCKFVCRGFSRSVNASMVHDFFCSLMEAFALFRFLDRKEHYILHAHSRVGLLATCLVAIVRQLPSVVHVHFLARNRWVYKLLWRLSSPTLVFNSRKSCRHYGFDPDRSAIVMPAIIWPGEPPVGSSLKRRVVASAAYVPWKNLHLVIESSLEFLAQDQDARCVVFGKTADPARRQYVERLECLAGRSNGQVELAGWSEAWAAELGQGDVFVHLADGEAFGIVILEAFARGLPIVVNRGSFLDDLPPPQRDAGIYRVDGFNVEGVRVQLGLALQCSLSQAELYKLRKTVASMFSHEKVAGEMEKIYRL